MDDNETNNISALFKKPAPLNPALGLKKPGSSVPIASDPALSKKTYSHVNYKASSPAAKSQAENPVKKDFSLVDFSKNNFKTQQTLKSTLKLSADRRDVANALSDLRGGITKDKARYSLRKLAEKKGWSSGKTWAIRRKIGI